MRVTLTRRPPRKAAALAIGVWQGEAPESGLARALQAARFTGKEGETATVLGDRRVVALGLGPRDGMTAGRARRLGGALAAALHGSGAETLSVLFDLGQFAPHFALGLRLKAWRPRHDPEDGPPLRSVSVLGDPDRHTDALAEAVIEARDLVAAPGNALTPGEFAKRVWQSGLDVAMLDPMAEGLALLQAVGQGSAHPPCLAVARWSGGPPGAAPWVFVGKGITFDTGGISIKRDPAMHAMKGDMAGAAAAFCAVRALAARRAPVNAVAVLALAENMPSGGALRPGDVIRSFAGLTVEVVDTDAEGRLVLADALAWACARLKPHAVIDLATLTGAIVTTLGHHHAGLFTPDEALAARLLAAGEDSGEPLWRLPLDPAHDEALKSDIADLRNCAWGRVPDALHAARFLQHFIPEGVPWAHLDIAGTAEAAEDHPLGPKGPTGFGVRLLDALAG